jgi:hypothetical protein
MSLLPFVGPVLDLVRRFIPDKDKQLEAEREVTNLMANIATSEHKSDSWLTRSWRPWMMFMVTNLVTVWGINNFILAPYLFWGWGIELPTLALPTEFWNLIMLGFGVYGGARTFEKVANTVMNQITRRR